MQKKHSNFKTLLFRTRWDGGHCLWNATEVCSWSVWLISMADWCHPLYDFLQISCTFLCNCVMSLDLSIIFLMVLLWNTLCPLDSVFTSLKNILFVSIIKFNVHLFIYFGLDFCLPPSGRVRIFNLFFVK